jgi:hypothetical protein
MHKRQPHSGKLTGTRQSCCFQERADRQIHLAHRRQWQEPVIQLTAMSNVFGINRAWIRTLPAGFTWEVYHSGLLKKSISQRLKSAPACARAISVCWHVSTLKPVIHEQQWKCTYTMCKRANLKKLNSIQTTMENSNQGDLGGI